MVSQIQADDFDVDSPGIAVGGVSTIRGISVRLFEYPYIFATIAIIRRHQLRHEQLIVRPWPALQLG